jgi:hypothetical protein
MDYQTIMAEQALREQRLANIAHGQVTDNQHIAHCLELAAGEPDDLVRIAARLWLEHHAVSLAVRLVAESTPQH